MRDEDGSLGEGGSTFKILVSASPPSTILSSDLSTVLSIEASAKLEAPGEGGSHALRDEVGSLSDGGSFSAKDGSEVAKDGSAEGQPQGEMS